VVHLENGYATPAPSAFVLGQHLPMKCYIISDTPCATLVMALSLNIIAFKI